MSGTADNRVGVDRHEEPNYVTVLELCSDPQVTPVQYKSYSRPQQRF